MLTLVWEDSNTKYTLIHRCNNLMHAVISVLGMFVCRNHVNMNAVSTTTMIIQRNVGIEVNKGIQYNTNISCYDACASIRFCRNTDLHCTKSNIYASGAQPQPGLLYLAVSAQRHLQEASRCSWLRQACHHD